MQGHLAANVLLPSLDALFLSGARCTSNRDVSALAEIRPQQGEIGGVDATILIEISAGVVPPLALAFAKGRAQNREIGGVDAVVIIGVAFEKGAEVDFVSSGSNTHV